MSICKVCGKEFETLRAARICCSDACAVQRQRERMRANQRRASDAKRAEMEVVQEACEACVPHKRQEWEDKSPMDYG